MREALEELNTTTMIGRYVLVLTIWQGKKRQSVVEKKRGSCGSTELGELMADGRWRVCFTSKGPARQRMSQSEAKRTSTANY